ncbi:cyclic nucleotide-gated cation channel alpha-3-like isoform X2 [Argiope bruennichi]|uniref:cyclic nucleotide-gated cation channel alpha-3-like isoform X2 n=1 Tax=Argiope bruennichi TaxID=94029 RepID=UPI0024958DFF|nr:cyclic nucleotide-gated cation channel alpha-3-like isoform X2 [Argiope bruennichi]
MTSTTTNSTSDNDANNNSSTTTASVNPFQIQAKASRWHKTAVHNSVEQAERKIPQFVFDPDSALIFYWTAVVAMATLYNAWTIALRIAFPEIRQVNSSSYLPYVDILCDLIYFVDIVFQLRTAYLQDGIPVFDPSKIRQHYMSQTYFIQDVISVLPSQTICSLLPDFFGCCKYFLCTAGGASLNKLMKFHILYKFYDLAESFTSNPHLIRVLRLFLNLAIIIHWIACSYYLLSEFEGLGSNEWVYTNSTEQQRFFRKYIVCLYWSAMTLTTIGDTNTPETDLEYIFTGLIFMIGVFVFATVMGNVGDVISSMNANRQEFQARMDHIQMYLTHKKVPASLQLKIKKWAEYTWTRTKATDESRLLNMLPERLRAEVAVHVHLDSLKKVKIFEQCETGFLCELVLKLRSQVFSPGDYVCRVGETGREMFIINHGKVEVIVNNPGTSKPMVVAVLSEGNYFGEISLLRLDGVQNRRTADVRSIGYSELLCLSRRDLMAALVEYPEAKSVLEDQAKKRMKTNLQAQRAFSVDALLRNSQEHSSVDSGIVKDEERGQEVSEIKAMIEELKNANKVPGRTVWQLIARCEVLQAKLGEKEKEVEDSKFRIRELEQLLFSNHYPKYSQETGKDSELQPEKLIRTGHKVVKQYSQDEGRRVFEEASNDSNADSAKTEAAPIPHVKITKPASEAGDDGQDESDVNDFFVNNNFIKTSKITNIYEKGSNNDIRKRTRSDPTSSFTDGGSSGAMSSEGHREINKDKYIKTFKVLSEKTWDIDPTLDYNFSNETLINHDITLDDDEIILSTRFKDEFCLSDSSLDLNVHTIPEETEEEVNENDVASCSANENQEASFPKNRHYLSRDSKTEDDSMTFHEDKNCTGQVPRTCSVDNLPSEAIKQGQLLTPEETSGTQGMKRLQSAPGALLQMDTLRSGEAIDFLRMASMSSGFSYSDDTSSRKNSWTWGSEGDTDDEYASS